MTIMIDNGSSTSAELTWQGGKGFYYVTSDTWNSAVISLQFKAIDGTWIDVGTAGNLTADGAGTFDIPGMQLQVEVVGSPSNVYSVVVENQSRTRS